VQEQIARRPFPALVATIRSGPPRLSPWSISALDELANTVEFFVHHEDVRRAAPDWKPREISQGLSDTLWDRLRMAKFTLRKVPVGVEFARNDDGADGGPGDAPEFRMMARRGTPVVTVTGAPAELTLWATGRIGAANVRLDGTESATAMVSQSHWRLLGPAPRLCLTPAPGLGRVSAKAAGFSAQTGTGAGRGRGRGRGRASRLTAGC
jgi:uncharacterized protein (TIGR03085 family)